MPARSGSDNRLGKDLERVGPLQVISEGEVSDELRDLFKPLA